MREKQESLAKITHIMITVWLFLFLLVSVSIYKLLKSRIKGAVGERKIAIILTALDKSKYKVINNVVLDVRGFISQIDHVVISDFGVFIIETKNYNGWILGGENSRYWTQVIYKRKEKLYNPIRQNHSHLLALKHCLKEFPDIKYIPIVVFSTNATIKVKTTSEVIYTIELLESIRKHSEVTLSEDKKGAIFNRLKSVNIKAKYDRSQHIKSIKRRIKEQEEMILQDKCPRCRGILVTRVGKFGDFKGCSNFPSCKFTTNG